MVVVSMAARLLWWSTRYSPGLRDWIIRRGWRRLQRAADNGRR
jgi:hypothetical protein